MAIQYGKCKCGGTIAKDDAALTIAHEVPECEWFIKKCNEAGEHSVAHHKGLPALERFMASRRPN